MNDFFSRLASNMQSLNKNISQVFMELCGSLVLAEFGMKQASTVPSLTNFRYGRAKF